MDVPEGIETVTDRLTVLGSPLAVDDVIEVGVRIVDQYGGGFRCVCHEGFTFSLAGWCTAERVRAVLARQTLHRGGGGGPVNDADGVEQVTDEVLDQCRSRTGSQFGYVGRGRQIGSNVVRQALG